MAASTTSRISTSAFAPYTSAARVERQRRREITPQAGHALVILGHAIEYLADEFVHSGASLSTNDARLEAVQMLMALNRQIYFECPEAPSFGARCRALLAYLHLV
jgi:hypothetical protein